MNWEHLCWEFGNDNSPSVSESDPEILETSPVEIITQTHVLITLI